MPPAARISDPHMCPQVEPGPVPHVGGPIFTGSMNVIIGHLPAARIRDRAICVGPIDQVRKGAATVLINRRDAARRTDPMNHGGIIVSGCPTVIIGDTPQSFTFRAAAKQGTPFCEECERARQKHEQEEHADELEPMTDAATLDDAEPPPGAVSPGALTAEHSLADLEALAAEPDQNDGNDEWRAEVRSAIAWNFYLDHAGGAARPSSIEAQVRGIDMTQPVKIVQIPPTNRGTLYQRGVPGRPNGQYFSLEPDIDPDALGVSEMVYPLVDGALDPTPVPRDHRIVTFPDDAPALGLQSIAAPIADDWSMPVGKTKTGQTTAQTVDCKGGATQLVVPHKFHP